MHTRCVTRQLATAFFSGMVMIAATHAAGAASTSTSMDKVDTTFMQDASTEGMQAIDMGKLALAQSSDAKVKALAQQLVDDHTKADDQLKTLAASKQVTLSTTPSGDAQKEEKNLQTKRGDAFDQAWLKEMVKDHQKTIKTFTQENKSGKDADVRQFAQTTLPVLDDHLKTAKDLAAVYDARDKSMDQTTKSLSNDPMNNNPAITPGVPATPAPAPTPAAKGSQHG